jgi:hypothetical protein
MNEKKTYKLVAYSNQIFDYSSWLGCYDNLDHTPRYIVKGRYEVSVKLTITIELLLFRNLDYTNLFLRMEGYGPPMPGL